MFGYRSPQTRIVILSGVDVIYIYGTLFVLATRTGINAFFSVSKGKPDGCKVRKRERNIFETSSFTCQISFTPTYRHFCTRCFITQLTWRSLIQPGVGYFGSECLGVFDAQFVAIGGTDRHFKIDSIILIIQINNNDQFSRAKTVLYPNACFYIFPVKYASKDLIVFRN